MTECACGNEARYVDETGALTCALCPLKAGIESWRISDVPAIIRVLAKGLADKSDECEHLHAMLRRYRMRRRARLLVLP